MSSKRKLSSDSETEDTDGVTDDNSFKRKLEDVDENSNEDNIDDQLKAFEEKYHMRYTEDDDEYKRCVEKQVSLPPIIWGYYGKSGGRDRFRDNQHKYGSHNRHNYDNRRGGGSGGHHYNRQSYNNYNQRPYKRW